MKNPYSFYDLADDLSNREEVNLDFVKKLVKGKLKLNSNNNPDSNPYDDKYIKDAIISSINISNLPLLKELSPLISDDFSDTVLIKATKRGHIDILKYILDSFPPKSIKEALYTSISNHLRQDVSVFLSDYTNKNENYDNSFASASLISSYKVVEKMLPLNLATPHQALKSIKLIIRYSSDFNGLGDYRKKVLNLLIDKCTLNDLKSLSKSHLDGQMSNPKKVHTCIARILSTRISKEELSSSLKKESKTIKKRVI